MINKKVKTENLIIKKAVKGYGLMELMLTISIIGLLTMIVYPNYKNYVIKTKRIEMMVELQYIATKIHAKALLNGNYHTLKLSSIFSSNSQSGQHSDLSEFKQVQNRSFLSIYPENGAALYTISLTPIKSGIGSEMSIENSYIASSNWKLIATPIDGELMGNDGQLTLNSEGIKCHVNLCQ